MSDDNQDYAVRVSGLHKEFVIAEKGKEAVSLWSALRSGSVSKGKRKIAALHDISFDIPSGQRVGIIGHNGAGKTTLLSILAGVAEPSTGNVTINGDVHALLTIGAVLREEVTGRENIRLDGAVHGKTAAEIDRYEQAVIDFSELGEFIDRPVRTYSSGMKARLAFSMGAFVQPDVLIIDEALSVGDAFFSQKATKRMKEVAASGRAVIVVSHSLASIVDMCDRCIWMEHGRIVMDGPPKDVTRAYEASVRTGVEEDLIRKFNATATVNYQRDKGTFHEFQIRQGDVAVSGVARVMQPLELVATGTLKTARKPEIELAISRVDGREIYLRSSQTETLRLPDAGPFELRIEFDPMILGADLYRFELRLKDGHESLDSTSRVCEMIDEEGQFGGVSLLLAPPGISISNPHEI